MSKRRAAGLLYRVEHGGLAQAEGMEMRRTIKIKICESIAVRTALCADQRAIVPAAELSRKRRWSTPKPEP